MNYILKVTNGCNMRCSYCCVGDKSDFGIITEKQLYKNLKFSAENTIAKGEKNAYIIFHGGEPTLLESSIYRKNIERISNEYKEIEFHWRIQTNGLNITDDHINLFCDYKFNIGVSIDGSSVIHDSVRFDIDGKPTYNKIVNNILKMKREKLSVSALMVVNSNASNDYSYLKFFDRNNINIKINPLIECGEAENNRDILLKPGEYADYIIGAFEYIINNELNIDIQPIGDIFNKLINKSPYGECTFSENCFANFMAIDYNGDIYPCGRFCDVYEFRSGNVSNQMDMPFDSGKICRGELVIGEKCHNCVFRRLCSGGCAFMFWKNNKKENPLCYDYKKIFKYFITEGILLLENKLTEKRERLYNATIN